jgi:hypothetical protein
MSNAFRAGTTALTLAATLAAASARAQPSMAAKGCCCVAKGTAYTCSEKTQTDCLALQPKMPAFAKHADFKKAWSAYVADSKAQASAPMQGGWIAEACEK